MIVLGIETSCDETAAAIIKDEKIILSNIVSSQVLYHSKFGGVVPEIASRKHQEMIVPVVKEALRKACLTLDKIEGIAVTFGPGLVGSLLVGLSFAKATSMALDIPLIGINHLEGHIHSIFLEEDFPSYPFLALVVSGGHTSLFEISGLGDMLLLGQTRDDAAGEVLDKVSKFLDLGYPGGSVVEELAREGDPVYINFPRAMIHEEDNLDFSFSGLKTAALRYIKKETIKEDPDRLKDFMAAFQEAVVDILVQRTMEAARRRELTEILVCGGVACNSRLRQKMEDTAREKGKKVFFPPTVLCQDNAAMVGACGERYLKKGIFSPLSMDALSRGDYRVLSLSKKGV